MLLLCDILGAGLRDSVCIGRVGVTGVWFLGVQLSPLLLVGVVGLASLDAPVLVGEPVGVE